MVPFFIVLMLPLPHQKRGHGLGDEKNVIADWVYDYGSLA